MYVYHNLQVCAPTLASLYEPSEADTECILFGRSGLFWAMATQHNTQTTSTYP